MPSISRGPRFGMPEMLVNDAQIALVRFEEHVEEVARERDGADGRIDRDVADHPRDLPARQAEPTRFPDDVAGERRRDGIADARHQPDHRIESRRGG